MAEHGYEQASTNKIADAAGTSPGSIYQYFQDKDAILFALSTRLVDQVSIEVAPVLRTAAALPRDEATRALADAVLDALDGRAAVLRAIAERLPANRQAEILEQVLGRVSDVAYHLLIQHADDREPEALERATWMIVQLSYQLCVRYVLDAPPFARADFIDGLERAIVALIP
jgi:AcrR family transcriptional regulator